MDDADEAQIRIDRRIEEGIARAREAGIPKGAPGECDICGTYTQRLVLGVCARCRDERGLP